VLSCRAAQGTLVRSRDRRLYPSMDPREISGTRLTDRLQHRSFEVIMALLLTLAAVAVLIATLS